MNYRANVKGIQALLSFLVHDCCNGRTDLCGFDPASSLAETDSREVPPSDSMIPAFNVLFLCTHNSARSIMAESLLEKLGNSRFRAYSAGAEPAREPLPEVIERLNILGHHTSHPRRKSWSEFKRPSAPRMDFIIALCDVSYGQFCHDLDGQFVAAAWPLPDPTLFTGSPVERAMLLDELYLMIRRRIEAFAELPFASMDRLSLKTRLDGIGDASFVQTAPGKV